jgi:hypothetical protein
MMARQQQHKARDCDKKEIGDGNQIITRFLRRGGSTTAPK